MRLCLLRGLALISIALSARGSNAPSSAPAECLSPTHPRTAFAAFDAAGVARAAFCVDRLSADARYEIRLSAPAWSPARVRLAAMGDGAPQGVGEGAGGARDGDEAAAAAPEGEKIFITADARVLLVRFERSGPAAVPADGVPFDVRVDELIWGGRVPRAAVVGLTWPVALAIFTTAVAVYIAAAGFQRGDT